MGVAGKEGPSSATVGSQADMFANLQQLHVHLISRVGCCFILLMDGQLRSYDLEYTYGYI